MKGIKNLLFLIVILGAHSVLGQSVSSVYSNRGIGLINYGGLPNNFGMGEVGIATPSPWQLNYQNPAFLPFNRVSVFQMGIEMDRRNISSSAIDAKKVSGGLRYLNFAFPIVNGKWTTSFGMSPYSTVNTTTFSTSVIGDETTATTTYSGTGGLTQFYWSNGFALGKGLYAGIRTSFLFGSVEYVESSVVDGGLGSYDVSLTDRSSYIGLKTDLSLGYRKQLTNKDVVNFGLVYGLSKGLKGRRDQFIESTVLAERDIVKNEAFTYSIPASVGFGASYQSRNNFSVASDVVFTNWGNGGEGDDNYLNTTKVAVGGEWTPDFGSVNNYLKRITYKVGFNMDRLPYAVENQAIREVGINFGASFPVRFSNLDLAFKYGRLGTLNNNLVRETYFRIVMGATINDRWFVKRRYD